MSDFENKPSDAGSGQGDRNESLQLQLTLQLLALVLMAATLAFFFFVQARRAKFDLNAIKPPATELIQTFEREQPSVNAFIAKIAEYGRKNPDFMPIMQKYAIPLPTNAPAAVAPKPAATTAPKPAAPAPAPKK